jgi:hypothetical protein
MPGLFGDLPAPAPKPPTDTDDAGDEREQKRQRREEAAGQSPLREHKTSPSCSHLFSSSTDAPARSSPPSTTAGPPAEPSKAPEAAAPPLAAPPAAPPADQVAEALRRIRSHISNPQKFPKASELLRQTLSGQGGAVLDPRTHGPSVFSALAASMTHPSAANDPLLAREYSKLFTAASKRPELFSPSQLCQLDAYGIRAVLLNQMLTTDDSFAFSRTVNIVKAAIDELPPLEAPEQEEEEAAALTATAASNCDDDDDIEAWDEVRVTAQRRAALVACVAAGKECYGRAWARTAVDLMVGAAAARTTPQDQRFLADQRAVIAEMVQFVRDQKAARKLVSSNEMIW